MNRARSRSTTYGVPYASERMYKFDGTPLGDDRASGIHHIAYTESMTDVVTEGYYELKKLHAHLPVNPMTHTKIVVAGPREPSGETWRTSYLYMGSPYQIRDEIGNTAFWCDGSTYSLLNVHATSAFGSGLMPDAPELSYLLQEARARAHSSNSMDLGTMLAEIDKSADLVKDVHKRTLARARRVIDAATFSVAGSSRRRSRHLDMAGRIMAITSAAAQIWLEYRFGWRLLVKDLEDIHALYSRVENTFKDAYKRGTFQLDIEGPKQILSTKLNSRSWSGGWSTHTNWGQYNYEEYRVVRRSIRVGAMVKYTGRNPFYFVDPLTTAWELVPLSWVADMFGNIGSALRAWSPFLAGVPVHQWMTDDVRYLHGRHVTPNGGYGNPPNTYNWLDGSGPTLTSELGWSVKTRVPVAMTMPTLTFNPGIPKIVKLVDLAAVVSQFGNRLTQQITHNAKTNLSWFR